MTTSVTAAAAAAMNIFVGDWEVITNPADTRVIEIANFALRVASTKANATLKLDRVLQGQIQDKADSKFLLVLLVKDAFGNLNKYLAMVSEDAQKKNLISLATWLL